MTAVAMSMPCSCPGVRGNAFGSWPQAFQKADNAADLATNPLTWRLVACALEDLDPSTVRCGGRAPRPLFADFVPLVAQIFGVRLLSLAISQ